MSESANFVRPDNEWTQQDMTHGQMDGVTEEIDAHSKEASVIHYFGSDLWTSPRERGGIDTGCRA